MHDPSEPVSRLTTRLTLHRHGRYTRSFWAGSVFAAGYVATLAFFGFVDVYNQHFFQSSYAAVYCAFRVLLTGYLFWIIYAFGRWATIAMGGRRFIHGLPVH